MTARPRHKRQAQAPPDAPAAAAPPLWGLHKAETLRDPLRVSEWIRSLIRMTSPHPAMTAVLDVMGRLQERPFRTNFVLLGEPGTGKEGLARALHQLTCPDGSLVRFDVAGFSDEDALAALAGTGGSNGGAAAAARGGTLLLEETAGMGPRTQAALIRLLKTGRIDPRDDSAARDRPRVCAIAMSDRDLAGEVRAGRFRHDLYWRLARVVLTLPPLRERKQDIAPAAIWMGNRILRAAGLGPGAGHQRGARPAVAHRRARAPWSCGATRSRRWRSTSGTATCASWRPCSNARCCCIARGTRWTARPFARRVSALFRPRDEVYRASGRLGTRLRVPKV